MSALVLRMLSLPPPLRPLSLIGDVQIYANSYNLKLLCCLVSKMEYDASETGAIKCLDPPKRSFQLGNLLEEHYLAFFREGCDSDLEGEDCAFGTNTIFQTESPIPAGRRRLEGDGRPVPAPSVLDVTPLGTVHTSCSGTNNVLHKQIGMNIPNFELKVVGATSSKFGKRLCPAELCDSGKGKKGKAGGKGGKGKSKKDAVRANESQSTSQRIF